MANNDRNSRLSCRDATLRSGIPPSADGLFETGGWWRRKLFGPLLLNLLHSNVVATQIAVKSHRKYAFVCEWEDEISTRFYAGKCMCLCVCVSVLRYCKYYGWSGDLVVIIKRTAPNPIYIVACCTLGWPLYCYSGPMMQGGTFRLIHWRSNWTI